MESVKSDPVSDSPPDAEDEIWSLGAQSEQHQAGIPHANTSDCTFFTSKPITRNEPGVPGNRVRSGAPPSPDVQKPRRPDSCRLGGETRADPVQVVPASRGGE